jgi:two-component system cell cycle sensor histidine kinase/response regulator CckA
VELPLRVLIIEDSADDALLLARELRRGGYDPVSQRVETAAEMEKALEQKWDLIISDYSLPAFDPLRALKILKDKGLDIPCIVVSGGVDETTILAAMRAGASDYVMKDNLMRLGPAVDRELREAEGRRERRRLQEQFRHAQKLEAIGRLASGMAHDFNNLLTVITGYAEMLLADNTLSASARARLDEIRSAAGRGSSLTRQLLIFSRKQPMVPKVIHLNELVSNMEKMLHRLIGEDINLKTVLDPELNSVQTDTGQFEQVIMNLVVNARDAMPGGGNLIIETQNTEFDSGLRPVGLEPGQYAMLSVTDSGIGMDAETRSHLFEPFFTTKAAGKGTGLGLATAYGIVRQSGGAISVYSEPGMGSTFRIYLPRVDAAAEAATGDAVEVRSFRGTETILLVEDDDRVRSLVRDVLRMRGYTVLECSDGREATETARVHAGPIDLLLTDVVLPEMSGPEIAKQVGALKPGVRSLFISGYADESILRHGMLEPGSKFLSKPFLPEALARKIREVLDTHD